MKSFQHHSPSLQSNIIAEEDPASGIAFFRGIPYASISQRWTQSITQNSLPKTFDATKFGPRCPQPAHNSLLAAGVRPDVGSNEFGCLNLNVTVPVQALSKDGGKEGGKKLLPVMVYVHGGRFQYGGNSDSRSDPYVLASLAKESGHPFVLVQINYRLGIFGFAASQDLASEHASITSKNSRPDYFGNFGLLDQKNAFLWVQNHIQDFGGDSSNVTAVGTSAGGGSLHMHVLSGVPLFDRAILMSGTAPAMGPLPLTALDAIWTKVFSSGEQESSELRLERLRLLSCEELIQRLPPGTQLGPVADGEYLSKTLRLGDAPSKTRCKEIIIGDAGEEGIVFDALFRFIPQNIFHQRVLSTFKDPSDVDKFCKYFGFTPLVEQPFEKFRNSLRFFISVIMFQYPDFRIAETFGGPAYLYHFEDPSPFEGPSYGLPVHGQDTIYLYGCDTSIWPESSKKVSLEIAKKWAAFTYGEKPWEEYSVTKQFMRFGPGGESLLKTLEEDDTRDYGYLGWLREHFLEVMGLLSSFA